MIYLYHQHCHWVADICFVVRMIMVFIVGILWLLITLVCESIFGFFLMNFRCNDLWFYCKFDRCPLYRFSEWPWKSCDIRNNGTKWLCFGFVQLGSICSSLGLNVLVLNMYHLNLDSNEPFHWFNLPLQCRCVWNHFQNRFYKQHSLYLWEKYLKSQCVFAPNFLQ